MASTVNNVAVVANQTFVLLPPNPDRTACSIWFDSTSNIYVKIGPDASVTDYSFIMGSGATQGLQFYEPSDPRYTGPITAYTTSAAGTVRATEFN